MKLKLKKDKTFSTNIFYFSNLHTIQYIIYILLLLYYRISNTDTINELCTLKHMSPSHSSSFFLLPDFKDISYEHVY